MGGARAYPLASVSRAGRGVRRSRACPAEISDQVGALDMANVGSISFSYGDRFTVILGNGENVEYKLVMLGDIMAQLSTDDKGKIDLSDEIAAHFIPS